MENFNNKEEEEEKEKENKENITIQKGNKLFGEFNQKCLELEDKFIKESNIYTPGAWMNYDFFLNCFNHFLLYKNSLNFKYKLYIDNIWYNYENDLFEEKESSNIIHLRKENNNKNKKDKNVNPFIENELYILFEPNGEKNFKSISSGLEYESNKLTKNANKFNDFEYSIILRIFEKVEGNIQIKKIKEYIMKGYHTTLNINLTELNYQNNNSANEYFIIIQGNKCPFGYYMQLFSNYFNIENYTYSQFMVNYNNYIEKKFEIMHPTLKKYNYYLMAHFIIEINEEENKTNDIKMNKIVRVYNDILNYDDNYIKNNIEAILINNITHQKINLYCKKSLDIDFNICSKYIIELSLRPPQDISEKKFEFSFLYNNPNIKFILCPNIQPFFIREKYLINKNLNIFNELIYPSEEVTAAFSINLEYRPSKNDTNEENLELNDEILPEEQNITFDIPLNLSLDYGEKNILKKNFINNTIIRNLTLRGKLINAKEKDKNKPKDKHKQNENNDNNKFETYILKCSLDPYDCPDYLKDISLYNNDFYWNIAVFSTDPICFVKNTIKEDMEEAIKEKWEIRQPGRAAKAKISRQKFFLNIKSKSGELLTEEEQEILNNISNFSKTKEAIESNSNMIITNIPHKINKIKSIEKIQNKGKNKIEIENSNNINNKYNFLFKNEKNDMDIKKRIPKIKKYFSFVMKNFYSYTKQNRVVTKNTRGNKLLKLKNNSLNHMNENFKSLPNIYCKTNEEKLNEMKKIEENCDKFNNLKILENNKSQNNIFLYKEENNKFMKKYMDKRFKLENIKKENNNKLLNIIKLNNSKLDKIIEIKRLDEIIIKYKNEIEQNKDAKLEEELLLKWYRKYKKIIGGNNEYLKDIQIMNNIEKIKNNLVFLIEIKIKEIKKTNKKDNKLKKLTEISNELNTKNKKILFF